MKKENKEEDSDIVNGDLIAAQKSRFIHFKAIFHDTNAVPKNKTCSNKL